MQKQASDPCEPDDHSMYVRRAHDLRLRQAEVLTEGTAADGACLCEDKSEFALFEEASRPHVKCGSEGSATHPQTARAWDKESSAESSEHATCGMNVASKPCFQSPVFISRKMKHSPLDCHGRRLLEAMEKLM